MRRKYEPMASESRNRMGGASLTRPHVTQGPEDVPPAGVRGCGASVWPLVCVTPCTTTKTASAESWTKSEQKENLRPKWRQQRRRSSVVTSRSSLCFYEREWKTNQSILIYSKNIVKIFTWAFSARITCLLLLFTSFVHSVSLFVPQIFIVFVWLPVYWSSKDTRNSCVICPCGCFLFACMR